MPILYVIFDRQTQSNPTSSSRSEKNQRFSPTNHRYLGSVILAFKTTLTTTINHITCINTFGQGFKKTLLAINALLIANRVFSKTYLEVYIYISTTLNHKSIYTSFMTEGSGNQLTPSTCATNPSPPFSLIAI